MIATYMNKATKEDAKAIAWINENIEGRPVILEANGDSYTLYNRVSFLTGCPTVVGWHTHAGVTPPFFNARISCANSL